MGMAQRGTPAPKRDTYTPDSLLAVAVAVFIERGLGVFADKVRNAPMDAKAKEVLFGAAQYQQH